MHASHRSVGEQCHETTPADQCPMKTADGTACPMHQSLADHSSHNGAPADCTMTGSCNGPALALSSLFSVPAVLPDATVVIISDGHAHTLTTSLHTPNASPSLDTPPPKA